MAEQTYYNKLYGGLSPAEQNEYGGYKIARGLGGVENANLMATGTDFQDIYAAEQAAEANKPNMWNPMNWIFSPAESAMPTPEERAAIERRSADIERRYGEDTSDLSGIAETSVWGNPRYDTTLKSKGRIFDIQHPENWRRRGDKDFGYLKSPRTGIDPLDPIVHDRYPDTAITEFWNRRENPALRYYSHLFGDEGIPAVKNVQATMGPEETITAEEQIMTRPNFGRIDPLTTNQKPGLFEGIGQKLGMTQVSPEDRIANKQFMQDQRIRRDPQTGRMTSGDFAGQNAPGTSGWGSANFDEMRGKWLERFGDVDYSDTPIGLLKKRKQDKFKREEAAYQAKIQQQAIQEKMRQDALRGAGAYSSRIQLDPGTGGGGSQGTWHGQTAAKEAAGQQVAGPGFGHGAYFYRGGRVGYNTGGRVGILSIF